MQRTDYPSSQPPEADDQELQALKGEVLRILFSSDDGYTVLKLVDASYKEHTLVGPVSGVVEGQEIEAVGSWEKHPDHGPQLRVQNFRAILPTNEDGIQRYLSSGIIPGIGPKMAERIVDRFGVQTLDVLDNSASRLKEVPGLGRKRLSQIQEAWQQHREQRDVFIFLQGQGLGWSHCIKLYKRYGSGAAEVINKNPYRLASEVHGIGFRTADRIARNIGIHQNHPLRLSAGVVYTLQKMSDSGHTCCPLGKLVEEAGKVLQVKQEDAEKGLNRALTEGVLVRDTSCGNETHVYLREFLEAEQQCAAEIASFATLQNQEPWPAPRVDVRGIELNQQQQDALKNVFQWRFSIITGGPGVGKTTVVGQIVEHARKQGRYVLLTAPTGRAAKKLSESSRIPAKTVHRLLKWDPAEGRFFHNAKRPLRCDLLILDEASMLDLTLAENLFSAIAPETHVVLVGDKDQLPSVGAGNVLKELIECRKIPVTHLTEIYRQGSNSRIVSNAHCVNSGTMPDLTNPARSQISDFYWIDIPESESVSKTILKLVAQRIPGRFHFNPLRDIQVLAPMNRGSCGTVELNSLLQKTLNPRPREKMVFGERVFCVGDRVMQVVNNYDKGVFNGDMGLIADIDPQRKIFSVNYDGQLVEYEKMEADQIRLSYAVTIHKSQGSEFPVVVVPVLTQHFVMLQRNLVYTAMTRAKKLLVMLGTRKALAMAVRNNRPTLRYTLLGARIRRQLDKPHGGMPV